MSVRSFTNSLCKTVIDRVREKPEIWLYSHPLHKKRFLHNKFWKELALELGVNDDVLKKRWKHMKDHYRKELVKAMGKDEEDMVGWKFFKDLSFLRDEVLHRRRERVVAYAIDEDSVDDEPKAVESDTLNKPQPVRTETDDSTKINVILKRLTRTKQLLLTRMKENDLKHDDPDYMYLVSLLPNLKQLSEVQKLKLKGKINSWLLEALAGKEYENAYDDNTKYHNMKIIKCENDSE